MVDMMEVGVLLGLVGLAVCVVGVLAVVVNKLKTVAKSVGNIEDATNHRHEKKPDANGQPPGKLYDIVLEMSSNITHLVERVDAHEATQKEHRDLLKAYGDQLDMLNRALETRGVPAAERAAILDQTPPTKPQGT